MRTSTSQSGLNSPIKSHSNIIMFPRTAKQLREEYQSSRASGTLPCGLLGQSFCLEHVVKCSEIASRHRLSVVDVIEGFIRSYFHSFANASSDQWGNKLASFPRILEICLPRYLESGADYWPPIC